LGLGAGALLLRSASAFAARSLDAELMEIPVNPAGGFDRAYGVVGFSPGQGLARLSGPLAKSVRSMPSPKAHTLRIFHFNDMHNNLSVNKPKRGPKTHGHSHPMAQMVKRVRKARSLKPKGESILFLSGGDDRTGGNLDQVLGNVKGKGFRLDPAYTAYSAAGVDAGAIGNHEFDHGAKTLVKGIHGQAKFPLLSANLTGARTIQSGRDYYPAIVAVTGGLRIGMIGLLTPIMKYVRKSGDSKLKLVSPSQTLREILPAIAEVSDVVLILSHCGYGKTHAPPRGDSSWRFYLGEGDLILAKVAAGLTDKPTMIIGGHTHTALNPFGLEPQNIIDGIPIVQAGGRGRYLGEAVLRLAADQPTAVAVQLHKTKWRDDTLQFGDDGYANVEHDPDFDHDYENKIIAPMLRLL